MLSAKYKEVSRFVNWLYFADRLLILPLKKSDNLKENLEYHRAPDPPLPPSEVVELGELLDEWQSVPPFTANSPFVSSSRKSFRLNFIFSLDDYVFLCFYRVYHFL